MFTLVFVVMPPKTKLLIISQLHWKQYRIHLLSMQSIVSRDYLESDTYLETRVNKSFLKVQSHSILVYSRWYLYQEAEYHAVQGHLLTYQPMKIQIHIPDKQKHMLPITPICETDAGNSETLIFPSSSYQPMLSPVTQVPTKCNQ